MTDRRAALNAAREAAEDARCDFLDECEACGFADEWDAYRVETWPPKLTAAHREYAQALQAFYLLRDGPGGFLGRC